MEEFKMTEELAQEIGRNLNVDHRLMDILVERLFRTHLYSFGMTNRDQAVAFVIKELQHLYS